MKKIYFLLLALLTSSVTLGQTLYDADFTNDGDGFADHTTTVPPADAPASVSGGTTPNDWVLSYDTTPATDGSANSFSVSGGALVSDDWGGQGIFESASIDVSMVANVNISALTQVTGANDNLFRYFYILDGGSRVETIISDFTSDLEYTVGLDVSGAANLVVGFEFSENGGGDGYTTTFFKVDNAACAVSFQTPTFTCASNTVGDNNDTVTINIPYTGSDAGITSVTTTSAGTIAGDNPASVADGTIIITGLAEGDAWDVILNGGDCDTITDNGTVPAAECDPLPNTCFDLSAGTETFEIVTVTPNTAGDEWVLSSGTYSLNAYCGSGCVEAIEAWLVFGPLDMTGVTDLNLALNAAENFGVTDLNINYTNAYTGCPSSSTWTTAQTLTDAGSYNINLSAATGTDVFIAIQYIDDGVDGYSGWDLSNVSLDAFGACPSLGMRPTSDCAVCDVIIQTETFTCATNTEGDNNDQVTIIIPYSGTDNTITSVTTTTTATVGGDDPASVADGTITLTGLSEGDSWNITLNGGDCDGTTVSGTVPAANCDPVFLIINEIHADPSNAAGDVGDANGDGVVDSNEDEFIEIYNSGTAPIDLSNYVIADAISDRHIFPIGTILPANSFITIFGGGTPTGISFFTQTASSGVLSLNNGGDTVTIKDENGISILIETYTNAGNNQSIARNPDFTGAFVDHTSITTNPVLFSPGAKNDGTSLSTKDFTSTNFSIYPNPTNTGYIEITTTSKEAIDVVVFDILGKQVLSKTINNRLDVSKLNTGLYILKLNQKGATVTKKLVIK